MKNFHNKDRGLLSGSSDNTIKEMDFEGKKLIQEFSYKSGCSSLSISFDDKFILSGHDDGVINLWTGNMDKKTEAQYKKLMTGFVPFLLVMNLGRLGEKAEYMTKSSLFILLHVFLPLLRLKKNGFIRNLRRISDTKKG